MAQTSTLCNEEALKEPANAAPATKLEEVPSGRVLRNILEFSRNLEVRSSSLLTHISYVKS